MPRKFQWQSLVENDYKTILVIAPEGVMGLTYMQMSLFLSTFVTHNPSRKSLLNDKATKEDSAKP
jgi:hypothetical protein